MSDLRIVKGFYEYCGKFATLFRILAVTIFLGGIGRLIPLLMVGASGKLTLLIMIQTQAARSQTS